MSHYLLYRVNLHYDTYFKKKKTALLDEGQTGFLHLITLIIDGLRWHRGMNPFRSPHAM